MPFRYLSLLVGSAGAFNLYFSEKSEYFVLRQFSAISACYVISNLTASRVRKEEKPVRLQEKLRTKRWLLPLHYVGTQSAMFEGILPPAVQRFFDSVTECVLWKSGSSMPPK